MIEEAFQERYCTSKVFSYNEYFQTYSIFSQLDEYEAVMVHEHALQTFGKSLIPGELPLLNSDKKMYLTVYDSQNAIPREDLAFKNATL